MAGDERARLESLRRRALSPSLDHHEFALPASSVQAEFGSRLDSPSGRVVPSPHRARDCGATAVGAVPGRHQGDADGTTFSVGDTLFFAHAGDSRAYLVRDGSAMRVLCTNGLAGAISADTIADVLASPRDLTEQCRQLVDLAELEGASDDMTVVAGKYTIRPSPVTTTA